MPHVENNGNPEGFVAKAIKVIAMPIAAASGYWVAARRIYVNAYDNAKEHGLFRDLINGERKQGMERIGAKAVAAAKAKTEYEILEESIPFHKVHTDKVLERFKDVGLGSTRKRWGFLRTDQKQAAIIEFMTVAGIAIGALLTVANNKTISHLFSNEQEQSIS